MNLLIPLPTDADIDTFEREFLQQTYHFTNRDLLRQALQGSGPFNPNGNKVLALAGDAFLRQALVDQGRDRAKCPEDVQNTITKVASNNNLYEQGVAIGLDPFIVKNPGQLGLAAGKNVMATTMEAIMGAVYYDSNRNRDDCERVMATIGLSWPE